MKRNFHVVHPCQLWYNTFYRLYACVETAHSVGILKCYYWDAKWFKPVAGRREKNGIKKKIVKKRKYVEPM